VRTTLAADRRYVALQVTAQGEALLATVLANARASLVATVDQLSDAEREQVMAALLLLQSLLTDARSA
jgi:DNA-binding MarR family transcriptional regulator